MAPKPLSVANALKRLTPLAKDGFAQSEESEVVTLLERLPPGLPMDLVAKVMKRLAEARGVEWVFRAPRTYSAAVTETVKSAKQEPLTVFLLAALPSSAKDWGEEAWALQEQYQSVEYISLARYRKNRARFLERVVKDARTVAGAQATLAAFPDDPHSLTLVLACEGSESSMDILLPVVTKLLKDPAELDFLRDDVAPLLTKPVTKQLEALIVGKTTARNSDSWGLNAARALGMTEGEALKFKINVFAEGDWPKLRMSFDSTKDPSVSGIWNFNEHVHFARHDPKKTPLQNLELVLEKIRLEATENDARWVRYEFSSPARAPFKKALAAWVGEQLPGVRLT